MFDQVPLLDEAHRAEMASEWLLARVKQQVALEARLFSEEAPAVYTRKAPLPSVGTHVPLQVALLPEGHRAQVAREGPPATALGVRTGTRFAAPRTPLHLAFRHLHHVVPQIHKGWKRKEKHRSLRKTENMSAAFRRPTRAQCGMQHPATLTIYKYFHQPG